MRCTMTGDLLKIDANLNNDSSTVKRIAYKFRWIDREGMRAWEEEDVEAAADVRELQPRRSTPWRRRNKAVDFRLILQEPGVTPLNPRTSAFRWTA